MWDECGVDASALRFEVEAPRRVGLVALSTDETSERDYARVFSGTGIELVVNRIAFANPVTHANLLAMAERLTDAASAILPAQPIDVLAFSCTSASVLIGDDVVEAALKAAKPEALVVTPPLAVAAGLRALGARRISILTPYSFEVSRPMATYFEMKGFSVDRLTALEIEDDVAMARLKPDVIAELAAKAISEHSDALFISCTALRSLDVVDQIEAVIGKPVVTSNHAATWQCLDLLKIRPGSFAAGQLMRRRAGSESAAIPGIAAS
ncbi:ectoine utilization protein EutA [Fulvimarina sp. MAC8]